MCLTLQEGISLNDAIIQAKQIDEQSKQAGFYQEAVDFVAWQGFANGRMEIDMEEGQDLVEEPYREEISESEQIQQLSRNKVKSKINQKNRFVENIQKELQENVIAIN